MSNHNVFERIYREVTKIPKGQTATYGEIALLAGTTPRVVGFALHANKDPINIPCHRVVFKDGSLAKGYVFGGEGEQKKMLIREGVCVIANKVIASRASPCMPAGGRPANQ